MEDKKPTTRKSAGTGSKPKGEGRPYRSRDGAQSSGRSRPDSRSNPRQGTARREGDRPPRQYGQRSREGAPSTGARGSYGDRQGSRYGDRPSYGGKPSYHRSGDENGRGYGRSREDGSDHDDNGYRRPRTAPAGGAQKSSSAQSSSAPKRAVSVPKRGDGSNYSRSYRGTSQRANSMAPRASPNRQNRRGQSSRGRHEGSTRQPMLNTHRVNPFKYDMKEILAQTSMDPDMASSFLATVIAKASRISIKEAKDYVKTVLDEGNITKDDYDKFCRLMDRYSKYR